MAQNFIPSSSFIYLWRILKESGIFLSSIFSLAKHPVFKSASTSTAVLIGLTPFSPFFDVYTSFSQVKWTAQ